MKITILLGSVREGRQSHRAAHFLELELRKREVETDLVDLAEEQLPILGQETDHPEDETRIKQIGKRIDDSDALIFVTPEYQGSFSGVIKNAIDHYFPEFQKKPIGVVAASAGGMAGINASNQLQHVILSLGAFPMPMKLLIPRVHNAFNDNFEPQIEKVVDNTGKFLDEFLWFADAIVEKKKKENQEELAA